MAKKRSYNEWQERGRQVQRGEKAAGFDENGTALFKKRQTMPRDYSSQPFYGSRSQYAEDYSDNYTDS